MRAPQIHPSAAIGPRVTIGADARVGPNCRLDGETTIGARAHLLQDVTLVDTTVGDDCVLGSAVCVSDRAVQTPVAAAVVLGAGVHVGAGSVLVPGVRIGAHARIEADSTVSRALPPHAIAKGNPAVVVGFATTAPAIVDGAPASGHRRTATVTPTAVAGVEFHRFPRVSEPRGVLSFAEVGRQIPFEVQRYFLVYGVPEGGTRGEHSHTKCGELLICVKGSVRVLVDDGEARQEFVLDNPDVGLHIPRLIWTVQYGHSPDAVLVVLASRHYDAGDYIKNYDDFLAARRMAT